MSKIFFSRNTTDLIEQFVKTEFKLKYNNSVLGFIWVLIKPLVIFLILYVVMSQVFPNGTIQYFPLYLLLGTILSGHFNEATSTGINALLNKQGLILKVNFPRYIVVISAMLLPAINFFINLSIYFFVSIAFFHKLPSLFSFIWFLLAYIMLFLLMLAFSLFTSIWHVKLRDIGSIWELLLQLLFWLTPVFYELRYIKERSPLMGRIIGDYNPVTVVLEISRNAFIYDQITRPVLLLAWYGVAIVSVVLGYLYFKKNVKKIAEDF
jgi:ABC-2 type transport system permease protein